MGPNTVEIWATGPLTSLLITLTEIESEKVCHSDMQNLRATC